MPKILLVRDHERKRDRRSRRLRGRVETRPFESPRHLERIEALPTRDPGAEGARVRSGPAAS